MIALRGHTCPGGHQLYVATEPDGNTVECCATGCYRVSIRGRPAPEVPKTGTGAPRVRHDYKPWTDVERALLRAALAGGTPWTEIARQLGRSMASMYHLSRRLRRVAP